MQGGNQTTKFELLSKDTSCSLVATGCWSRFPAGRIRWRCCTFSVSLREELELQLEVAHLQHGIRGAEAEEDARFVAELAEKLGLPFHLKEVILRQIKSAAGKGNLEELARVERYRFFAAVARERKLVKIATAHTQDDQAETVLMWLLRGSGLKGLGGIAADCISSMEPTLIRAAASVVIRPLLDVSQS